ncbi:MAG: four helix bundle protein [Candidatus Pacebacteria bacterium]|nr:four helix bundle protein [Candidatus Paceibacterota bacterium]
MQTYRDLIAWQKSIVLVREIYSLTRRLPKEETRGLISQMNRAAVSIPANIAEGYARKHRAEYIQFLRISFGSGAELETHLTIIKEVGMIESVGTRDAENVLNEVMRLLNKLIASLQP